MVQRLGSRRPPAWLVGVLAFTLVVGACGSDDGSGDDEGGTEASGEPVLIGTVWFNSGVAKGLGDSMRNGFMLAIDETNEAGGILDGRPIEVNHYDEGYSVEEAVTSTNKAIDDGVVAIAGGNDATTCVAIRDVVAEEGLPLAITACGAEAITQGEYDRVVHVREPFVESQADRNALSVLATWMSEQGYTSVQGVGVDSDWVRLTDSEFSRIFSSLGGVDYNGMIYFPYGTAEARVEVTKAIGSNPDLLYLGLWGKDVVVNAVTAARDGGFDGDIMINEVVFGPAEVEALGDAGNGVYSSTGWIEDSEVPESQAFAEAYEAKYGAPPEYFAELGYETGLLLANAINEAGTTDDPAAIATAMKEGGIMTPRGETLRFDENGVRLAENWIIIQAQDGGLVTASKVPLNA